MQSINEVNKEHRNSLMANLVSRSILSFGKY